MYMYIYTHVFIYVHVCIYLHVCIYVHVYIYVHMCIYMYMCLYLCTCVYIYAFIDYMLNYEHIKSIYTATYAYYRCQIELTSLLLFAVDAHFICLQCTETTSSVAMELEGLKRCLSELDDRGYNISTITTDRHVLIAPYLRTERPDIKHQFDCWHIAKGMSGM